MHPATVVPLVELCKGLHTSQQVIQGNWSSGGAGAGLSSGCNMQATFAHLCLSFKHT
jgi:hypothetical protein